MRVFIFTKHALEKFIILKKHKFCITRKQVIITLEKPDLIDFSRFPLFIAQKKIDDKHVLRVVFKKEQYQIKIITFYPGRVRKYKYE